MERTGVELEVPIVPGDQGSSLTLRMQRVMVAEARGEEIAALTPEKAPELLATFNRAYLDASEYYARVKLEQNRAEDALNRIQSVILVDKLPDLIKSKGLTSTADVRRALVELDPEYQAAKERLDFLSAILEYLKGKMKYLENAYTAVKKIMDNSAYNMVYQGRKSQLDGIDDLLKQVGENQGKFGKAR